MVPTWHCMGAPGFMTYWVGAAVFLLEFAKEYAPATRPLALLALQVDWAVIMLTAESSKENVANVTQLGINDYLVKPFEDAVLLEKASKILPLQLKPA